MSSIIELRKQELTLEIDTLVKGVLFFIDNKRRNEHAASIAQYLALNESELNDVGKKLRTIENGFDPKSESFETFERCIDQLKELQREIEKIQARGEAEQYRLQRIEEARQRRQGRNSASWDYAGTWASILALLGGIALGFGGCVSCMNAGGVRTPDSNGPHLDFGYFNLITGLLIGVIGGAALGALIGALAGQLTKRESGDSTMGIWLPIAGLVILILFGFWIPILLKDDRRIDPTGGFFIISECNTPCRMEVGDPQGQYFNTDHKLVLVKFNGRKEWMRYGDPGNQGISPDKYSPGMAEFISPENAPTVRVQILRKR